MRIARGWIEIGQAIVQLGPIAGGRQSIEIGDQSPARFRGYCSLPVRQSGCPGRRRHNPRQHLNGWRTTRRWFEHDVADDLVIVGWRLIVVNGCRQLLDRDLRALGDLHQRELGFQDLAQEVAGENGVGVRVSLTKPVERRLFGAGGKYYEYAFGRRDGSQAAGSLDGTRA